jgi:hypothetical protein
MPDARITLNGHILDSLILPKVLDLIVAAGAEYIIEEIAIGRTRHDVSHALIRIEAKDDATLARILNETSAHGASVGV